MVQTMDRPRLEVTETFEATRLSPQCLIAAYAQAVPITRKAIMTANPRATQPMDAKPEKYRGEHV